MKSLARVILAVVLLLSPVVGASAAVASDPPSPALVSGVDDFVFESFSAEYFLDIDENGRSTLRTVETFVAVFPDFDQNRGMRRAIPKDYQGVPTDVSIVSVTDENGAARPFEVETDEGFVLVTSRASDFLQGRQTFVFEYTQNNVTRFFDNTGVDELYWDTNGTGWLQPFGSVTATVHVPAELAAELTGDAACYVGYEGSTTPCDVARNDEAGDAVFTMSSEDLLAGQNLTFAIAFEPGTFVPRDNSYFGSVFGWLQALALAGVGVALIAAVIARRTGLADGRGRPTIIAEYAPPDDVDLITSSIVIHKSKRAVASQLIDWAVRGRIRIIEQPAQGFFARGNDYLLELRDPTGFDGAELQLAQALFGWSLVPGTGYLMSSKDTVLSEHVRAILTTAVASTTSEGYRPKRRGWYVALPILLAVMSGVGVFIFGVIMLDNAVGGLVPLLLVGIAFVAGLIVVGLVARTPLTEKGAELRDHLEGLKLYIRLAEADRLRMLQNPAGAEREQVSTADPRQVVKIYEKLLPYAVLFSLERQWAQELSRYYTEASPEWYSGTTGFNAALFASSIGSMSSTVSTSYSGSSSSSSSGGSGGGGSSGGGGGGGGGGGV